MFYAPCLAAMQRPLQADFLPDNFSVFLAREKTISLPGQNPFRTFPETCRISQPDRSVSVAFSIACQCFFPALAAAGQTVLAYLPRGAAPVRGIIRFPGGVSALPPAIGPSALGRPGAARLPAAASALQDGFHPRSFRPGALGGWQG